MSENQDRGIRDFSQYDTMKTEDLEELLRFDTDAPEGVEPDVDLILYVLEVLADRRRNNGQVTGKTALEAFESFKQDYLPEEIHIEPVPEVKKPERKPLRWLRGLTAAAAVLAFVFLGSVTAHAFGVDIWKAVAVWAQETFHLEGSVQADTHVDGTDRDLEYSSLADALERLEQKKEIVPTWIPEGYILEDITVMENPVQKIYSALYRCENKNIKITVRAYQNSYPEQIEQSDSTEETIEASGIIYHIFEDVGTLQAVWIKGSYECYISGEITMEQLEMMIHSIEKG